MNSNVKWKMQELQRSILDLTRNAEQYEEALTKTSSKADEINKMISKYQFTGSKYMSGRDDADDFESSSPPSTSSSVVGKSYGDLDFSDFSSESRYSSTTTSAKRYGSRSAYETDEDLLDFGSKYSPPTATSSRFGGTSAAKLLDEEDSIVSSKLSSASSSRVKRSDRLRQRRRSRHDLTIV